MGVRCADAIEAVGYLRRTIAEQEDQEPRQNYVEDLQLIHDRKKNDVCVPILPGHDQEAWFAKLDSNGIWKLVFEFLSDPSDVTSAYFACETFRKHLERKRKLMMLPEVFEVLRDTGHLQYWGFKGRTSNEKEIESREVLNQRLVSKAWKKSAEEVFLVPEEAIENRIGSLSNWKWSSDRTKMICRFQDVEDVEKALEKLRNADSCASLVRLIFVCDKDCGDKENFYSKIGQFLAVHGENVWGLHYFQDELSSSKNFNYEGLSNMVARMPHLKALLVDMDWDGHDFRVGTMGRVQFEDSKENLRSLIARKPFPDLSELEYLHIFSFPAHYDCLDVEIISKAPNLKSVGFSDWDRFDPGNGIPEIVWRALGNARLEDCLLQYESLGNLCVEDFLRLGRFNWPLQCLTVVFRVHGGVVELDASRVFGVLSKFNDTLVEFHFDVAGGIRLVNDRRSVVVDFPNLKIIDIDFP